MKRLALAAALASLAAVPAALAQSTPPDYVPPPSDAPAQASSVPPMPSLSADQSAEVQRQLAPYRSQIDSRVARGEISADEAGRLLQWREWQIARQVARGAPPAGAGYNQAQAPAAQPYYGQADQPSDAQSAPYYAPPSQPYYAPPSQPYYAPPPSQPYYVPYYGPYYAPNYYAPRYYRPAPYYWGASICAGGWGHHGGARICI